MESTIMRVSFAAFLLLAISISSSETAEWCKYEPEHACSCFPDVSHSYYALLCAYVSSPAQLQESVKRILSAKSENDTTPFHFHFSSSSKLPYLPQDLFQGANVKYIKMMDVELERLEDWSETESPLNALSQVLEEMFLVRVRYLDDWDWRKVRLERVEIVRIEECPFAVLKKSFSDAFPNLKELYVKHSDVRQIEPQALAFPNKKIEYVSFMYTKLSSLSRESFRRKEWTEDDRLDNLESLFFSENGIEWISDDFLVGMEKLQYLIVNTNSLTSLSKDFFVPCDKSEWSCALKAVRMLENPMDSEACQLLIDMGRKHRKTVEIPISLYCVCLLKKPGFEYVCETD